MGRRYDFVCRACGYATQVCGEREYGMRASAETMTCLRCAELVDVYRTHEWLAGEAAEDDRLEVCPGCASTELEPWSPGGPCPKCGTPIERGGATVWWD